MNDRDALLAAILAHPDEDTPRLALADWLDENGEPRYAAFIRAQIALADVPEWDARWVGAWHADRDALTGRGQDLFEPKLPDGLRYPALTSYRRGLPWHVETKSVEPFLTHADWLAERMPLQALTVRPEEGWSEPTDLTALLASPHLARLKQFNVTLARLTAETVRQVNACPHLAGVTELSFEFAGLEAAALAEVFRPPLIERLESLRFHNCSLPWSAVVAGVVTAGGPHRLKRFVVWDEGGSAYLSNLGAFAAPLLRGLREFEILGYGMGDVPFRALCDSPVASGLESLALRRTNPGVHGVKALAACSELRALKRLQLASNRIGPVAAKNLARSPHLSNLQVLDLSNNPLGDKGALALTEAPFLANLIELDLSSCDIGDAGATALMDALPAGKVLNLSVGSVGRREALTAGVRARLRDKFGGRVSA